VPEDHHACEQAQAAGWKVATRRKSAWPGDDDDVFVIDTMGELMAFYACAEVAFVGGSLQSIGGHNLLEPAAVGTAMVTGPHLHNFVEISRRLKEVGALQIRDNAEGIALALQELLQDPAVRNSMAAAGHELVEQGRGALARTLQMIAVDLPSAPNRQGGFEPAV
jgi:3-deoxy-D-manno-octulosonic-acid transferase